VGLIEDALERLEKKVGTQGEGGDKAGRLYEKMEGGKPS